MAGCKRFLKGIDLFGRRVNLRFKGRDKFKTQCGGCSTLVMFLTLTIIFSLGVYDVVMGELESFNSMILNIDEAHEDPSPEELAQAFKQQRVLAFGIYNPAVDSSYLKVTAQHVIGKNYMNMANQMYNCSRQVYGNLSPGMKAVVPANLRIICLNISAYDLDRGVQPAIMFSTCRQKNQKGEGGERRGGLRGPLGSPGTPRCKPLAEIQRLLRRLDIWAFTLADSTNYANSDNEQRYRYTASKITISYKYQKMACLTLRGMKIESKEGAFFQHTKVSSTATFYRDEQEITASYKENEILQLSLKMDRNSQVVISKEYKSIFSLFAYIGGLSKGIAIFFAILIFPVREVLYYQNLINNMFNVCLDQKQKEIALKTMFTDVGQGPDDDDDDEDSYNGDEGGGGSERPRRKQKRRHTDNGFYKKMMIRKNTSSPISGGGLFDDFIVCLSSEQIFNNMAKTLSHPDAQKVMGAEGFSNLLMKGMNLGQTTKKKRQKKLHTQPPAVLPTGEYRKLNEEEKSVLESGMVKLSLKNWLIHARTKVFQKHLKKAEQDKEKLQISMADQRKKRIMKILRKRKNKKGGNDDSDDKACEEKQPSQNGSQNKSERKIKGGEAISADSRAVQEEDSESANIPHSLQCRTQLSLGEESNPFSNRQIVKKSLEPGSGRLVTPKSNLSVVKNSTVSPLISIPESLNENSVDAKIAKNLQETTPRFFDYEKQFKNKKNSE